jgi:hypothetical protein
MSRFLTLTTMLMAPLCAAMMLATSEYGTGTSAFSDWWQAEQRAARLQDVQVSRTRSQEATKAIVSDLIEGRLSLREAAPAMFAEMERWIPPYGIFRQCYPGRSVEESILRWSVSYLEANLEYNSHRAEILRCMRAELQDYLDNESDPLAATVHTPQVRRDF